MKNDYRLKLEMQVVRAAVKAALAAGYSVSVNDGEEWTLQRSRSATAICKALRTTDEDSITMYDGDRNVGWLQFVYGNAPYEVIADYRDNVETNAIYAAAQEVADKVEKRC